MLNETKDNGNNLTVSSAVSSDGHVAIGHDDDVVADHPNSVSKSWFIVFNNPQDHGYVGEPNDIVEAFRGAKQGGDFFKKRPIF